MKKASKIAHSPSHPCIYDREKKQEAFRRWIRDLRFNEGLSLRTIAQLAGVSSHTVQRWTRAADQDCSIDGRGWKKGVGRVHTEQTTRRICALHERLTTSKKEFFTGATAIAQEWRRRYKTPPPPVRTIGRVLTEQGLSHKRKTPRSKGAASYLLYPEHTIYTGLGGRVLEVDFIGQKFLAGNPSPIHFISFSFKIKPCLRYYQRVLAETADVMMAESKRFFTLFEEPDFFKIDNGPAAFGSSSAKRTVSRVVQFLLQRQIVPIFSVPRRPFTQASVEGSNSMFARNFWKARTFTSVTDIDRQLAWLNQAVMKYHEYTPPPTRKRSNTFVPRVLFLRQVREHPEDPRMGYIDVLNECLCIPESFINYFVIAEWNLRTETIVVSLERDKKLQTIFDQSFQINSPNVSFE
jgi:transposase